MNSFHFVLWLSLVLISLISPMSAFLTRFEPKNTCHARLNGSANDQIVALVLARGGSKGISLKNLAKIDDISLLGRALKIIQNANVFDEIWVSTDNDQIAHEGDIYGANIHLRNELYARDDTTSFESVLEFLSVHRYIQNIALIQCTSVFLREHYLQQGVKLFRQNSIDCVFSVVRSWKLRWQEQSNNRLSPINFDAKNRPRRQDWHGELVETGMFYFVRRRLIEYDGVLQNDRCRFVEIDEKDALEIDDPVQLKLANVLVHLDDWR